MGGGEDFLIEGEGILDFWPTPLPGRSLIF
jgi:hypothetical protein